MITIVPPNAVTITILVLFILLSLLICTVSLYRAKCAIRRRFASSSPNPSLSSSTTGEMPTTNNNYNNYGPRLPRWNGDALGVNTAQQQQQQQQQDIPLQDLQPRVAMYGRPHPIARMPRTEVPQQQQRQQQQASHHHHHQQQSTTTSAAMPQRSAQSSMPPSYGHARSQSVHGPVDMETFVDVPLHDEPVTSGTNDEDATARRGGIHWRVGWNGPGR